jgi:hypothetical protein
MNKIYECCDCGTYRYLIFPYGNETLIICSACYQMRNILLKEKNLNKSKPVCNEIELSF